MTDTVLMRFIDKEGNVKARVHTEVADTPEKRRMGMSKRAFFPPGYGMFFDKTGAYWMKDVEFPIDILFLDKQGTVLEKQHMPVDSEDGPIRPLYIPSSREAEHALELPAGWFDKNGLAVGDKVVVKDPGHA